MRKKIRYLIFILIFTLIFYITKESYASFASQASSSADESNISIAKFVVNNEYTNTLGYTISDLKPGNSKSFVFKVKNTLSGVTSDVTVKYKISIYSYEAIPLSYSLKLNNTGSDLLNCSVSGDAVCETNELTLAYNDNTEKSYTLSVGIPATTSNNHYWDYSYGNNIDEVKVKIESWQAGIS